MDSNYLTDATVIEQLLKLIAWIAGIGVSIITVSLTFQIRWQMTVNKRLNKQDVFSQEIYGRLEQGAQTMKSHSDMLQQHGMRLSDHDNRFHRYDMIMQDVQLKTKALIKRHNLTHNDVLEEPTISS